LARPPGLLAYNWRSSQTIYGNVVRLGALRNINGRRYDAYPVARLKLLFLARAALKLFGRSEYPVVSGLTVITLVVITSMARMENPPFDSA
jgi:hypothetical protein